jgi:hypothetical protein
VAWPGGPSASAADAPGCGPVGGPCVAVEIVANGSRVGPLHYVAMSDILDNADVINQSYAVKGSPSISVDRGSSVRRLVAEFVDPAQVTFTEVLDNSNGVNRHSLAEGELGPPGSSGFPGGLAPVFSADDTHNPAQVQYLRPQRNTDDANGSPGADLGLFYSENNGSILVRVHTTGHLLQPTVTATATDATERTFALGTDPTGVGFAFDWHLPGGGTSTEATPTYSFPGDALAGAYPVTVGVENAQDGSFGYGTTTLDAGPKPTQSASPSPSTSPGTGGDGPGSAGPTHHPSASSSADPNPEPTGGTGGSTTVPTLPTVPTSGPTSGPTTGPTSEPATPGPTPTEPTQTPEPSGSGDQVTGILLTSADGTTEGGQVVSDAPQPSEAARPLGAPPFGISTTVLLGLGVLLLLLAGAGTESTRLRRWLRARWSKMSP